MERPGLKRKEKITKVDDQIAAKRKRFKSEGQWG